MSKETTSCPECGGGDRNGKHYDDCTYWVSADMTVRELRDQFAMAALTGILSLSSEEIRLQISPQIPLSMRCYEIADAMLEARKSK